MKSKRIQWLDFAKGITILSVVIIHSLCPPLISYVLDVFAMPLFFAISGYLYKQINTWYKYKLMIYKKFISLGIPYVIFTFFMIILHMILHFNDKHILLTFKSNFYHIYLLPIDYLWFLYALLIIFIIVGTMSLFRIPLVTQLLISVICLFSQMYLPWHMRNGLDVNPLAGIGGYMICFYIGYLIKRFSIIDQLKHIALSLSLLWILLVIIQIHLTGTMNYDIDLFNYKNVVTKLLSIPVFFSLFIQFNHNKFFKYFDKYGKYTLIIYLVHFPVIRILSSLYSKYLPNVDSILLFIIIFIIAWYTSLFVCFLSNKINVINFIFYPRRYINKIVYKTKWGKLLLSKK